MKTLVVVAHMDDESISNSGLIQNRISQGHEVHVLTVFGRKYIIGHVANDNWGTTTTYDHEKQAHQLQHFEQAMKVLGVEDYRNWCYEEGEPQRHGFYGLLCPIEEHLLEVQPDEVVIPSPSDLNQDHVYLHQICKIALRPANLNTVKRVLMWHAHDGGTPAGANWFEVMSESQLDCKQRAILKYEDERRTQPHPRSLPNIVAHAQMCGSIAMAKYAEPFSLWLQR